MKPEIRKLNLLNPLFCNRIKADPSDYLYREFDRQIGEMIFCFEIGETARAEFEPDRKYFPGRLVFFGNSIKNKTADSAAEPAMIPGDYLFLQKDGISTEDESAELAMDLHQECLWQRLKPANRYFLRYVYEDNRYVTQIFWAINAEPQP